MLSFALKLGSGKFYKCVEQPLSTRLIKVNFQLIAFNIGDQAIAKFLMEDPLPDRQIAPAFVAKANGAGSGFHDAGRLG
jgi:hypothetical protein